jgi:Uma2 family endonuclease
VLRERFVQRLVLERARDEGVDRSRRSDHGARIAKPPAFATVFIRPHQSLPVVGWRYMSSAALKILPGAATLADLLALPEQGRGFELIDGELIEKQAGFRHGRAQFNLAGLLSPYRRGGGGPERPGGWWFLTEQLVAFSSQVLRPDVAGWLRERLPEPPEDDDAVVTVRPDWVCEIISPRNAARDRILKKRIYHQHQVPHYWIVDPRDESLTVLQWTAKGYLELLVAQRGERVRAEPFPSLELQVGVLFGEDEDERSPGAPTE